MATADPPAAVPLPPSIVEARRRWGLFAGKVVVIGGSRHLVSEMVRVEWEMAIAGVLPWPPTWHPELRPRDAERAAACVAHVGRIAYADALLVVWSRQRVGPDTSILIDQATAMAKPVYHYDPAARRLTLRGEEVALED